MNSDQATLTSFFQTYYRSVRLARAGTCTISTFESILRRWTQLTGDPPLTEITVQTLARYQEALAQLPGKRPGSSMSANRIRSHLRHIQAILDKAGPPGPRNRDAAGLLSQVPWIRPPREEFDEPRIVSMELVGQVYNAADRAKVPRLDGVSPGAWWRALLVITWRTGLRRSSLLALKMADVQWDQACIGVRPRTIKNRRGEVCHLNPTAMEHLRAIRTERELVFEWPYALTYFHVSFHKLQDAAGLPREKHFGLHDIRRAVGTLLWEESPQAAQLTLGHASSAVTKKHYVAKRGIVARALDRLPEPAAFAAGASPPQPRSNQ